MSEEETAEAIEDQDNQQDEAGQDEGGIVTLNKSDPEGQEGEEGEEGEQAAESGEIEIVVDGEDGSQPTKKTKSFQNRVNKLNSRNAAATKEAEEAKSELEVSKQENKILKMALEQKQGPVDPVQPNPDDFDGGVLDPDYKTQQDAYTDFVVTRKIDARLQEYTQKSQQSTQQVDQSKVLESAAQEHWDRAEKLGTSDYEATEDKAREYLGDEIYKNIIMNVDGSELLIYHFGKNPEKAQEMVDAVKSNPVRGLAKLAVLGMKLKPQRIKTKVTPDPDTPLEGGQPATKGKRGPPGAKYS